MAREILDESHIQSAIRETVSAHHAAIVKEVRDAVAANAVVIVGMRQNPMPKYARKVLAKDNIAHKYLEYGSYFSGWRRRTALKMWTGWPTFPMIFVKGVLIGGADDLGRLVEIGALHLRGVFAEEPHTRARDLQRTRRRFGDRADRTVGIPLVAFPDPGELRDRIR